MHKTSLRIILISLLMLVVMLYGCANRVAPDGGPFDDNPPRLVSMKPAVGAMNVKEKRFTLTFDEYVTVKDIFNKVIISPPQLQRPTILPVGKKIVVELIDTLKPNTTYTIDFTDAIVDNNESNPLENFSVAFSTGDKIDTMEISGTVLNARNLEPVNGIIVGIHSGDAPLSSFTDTTLLRASRSSDLAKFVIRNIANGSYRVFALKESDNNYRYDYGKESIAFLDSAVFTSSIPAVRNDTIRKDSLSIDTIKKVSYTRYLPDDLVLLYSEPVTGTRYISKRERPQKDLLKLTFSSIPDSNFYIKPLDSLPQPTSEKWYVKDEDRTTGVLSLFITDTLAGRHSHFAVTYPTLDSLGAVTQKTDTISLRIPKEIKPKKTEKKDKNLSDSTEQVKPASPLTISFEHKGTHGIHDSILFTTSLPIDTTALKAIHLYDARDSILKELPWKELRLLKGRSTVGMALADLRYEQKYEIQVDTVVFRDVYGNRLDKTAVDAFETQAKDQFAELEIVVHGVTGPFIGELLDTSDKVITTVYSDGASLKFYDLAPQKYGFRLIVDSNGNRRWDPANLRAGEQPEKVYYAPKTFELMKNWEIKENFYPLSTPIIRQKPRELIQNKPKEKQKEDRNKRRQKERRDQAQREASVSSPLRF